MNIDKINNAAHIHNVANKNNAKAPNSPSVGMGQDSVSISQAALQARETALVEKAMASASDVRLDRVREVKEKLARGDYDNLSNEMLNQIATRLTTPIKNS
ncbi:MAG TPA: flagellar biosynthesis anti-sigma factor FlgM [Turneriella sp.]|nr:flagellar biosynthesis anti-sigma factor FlgM [Turneriella sp.]